MSEQSSPQSASSIGATEFCVYVGSSTVSLRQRVRAHVLEMNRPDNSKKFAETAHYATFGNDHDVVPQFRLAASNCRRWGKVMLCGIVPLHLQLRAVWRDFTYLPLFHRDRLSNLGMKLLKTAYLERKLYSQLKIRAVFACAEGGQRDVSGGVDQPISLHDCTS